MLIPVSAQAAQILGQPFLRANRKNGAHKRRAKNRQNSKIAQVSLIKMAFQLISFLPLFALIGWLTRVEADVSVSVKQQNSWQGGGQYQLEFRNNGPNRVCLVVFQLNLPSGVNL